MYFFSSHQREPLAEVKAHLVTEHAGCTGTRAVVFRIAIFKDMAQKVVIYFHLSICASRFSPRSPEGGQASVSRTSDLFIYQFAD